MKSKRVTSTWEFYRDNCEGFKEPMRKELRSLDGYVADIEAENAELREENERFVIKLNVEHIVRQNVESENGKLRELVADLWRFTGEACRRYPKLFDPAAQGGQTVQLNMIDAFEQRMAELGVEV